MIALRPLARPSERPHEARADDRIGRTAQAQRPVVAHYRSRLIAGTSNDDDVAVGREATGHPAGRPHADTLRHASCLVPTSGTHKG